jgi:hypothetical protein
MRSPHSEPSPKGRGARCAIFRAFIRIVGQADDNGERQGRDLKAREVRPVEIGRDKNF